MMEKWSSGGGGLIDYFKFVIIKFEFLWWFVIFVCNIIWIEIFACENLVPKIYISRPKFY